MGSAFFLPVAQTIFQNELRRALRKYVPDLDPISVLTAGADSKAIASFSQAHVSGITASYVDALQYTFMVGVPLAGVALLIGLFMPWFRYHNATHAKTNNGSNGGNEKTCENLEQSEAKTNQSQEAIERR
jgi:hypothetical protein